MLLSEKQLNFHLVKHETINERILVQWIKPLIAIIVIIHVLAKFTKLTGINIALQTSFSPLEIESRDTD